MATSTTAGTPADPASDNDTQLQRLEQLGKANRRAQIDGVVSGVAAGFLAGQVSLRLMKQSRNAALLSGLLAGAGAGYVIAQESLRLQLTKQQAADAELRQQLSDQAKKRQQIGEWETSETQGELLRDKYASTRGDH